MSGIVGPIIGGIAGAWIYYILIEHHHESQQLDKQSIIVESSVDATQKEIKN